MFRVKDRTSKFFGFRAGTDPPYAGIHGDCTLHAVIGLMGGVVLECLFSVCDYRQCLLFLRGSRISNMYMYMIRLKFRLDQRTD